MTHPIPAQSVSPTLFWMRVDAPPTALASSFDPAALDAVMSLCRQRLADCLKTLASSQSLYSPLLKTALGSAECLLSLPHDDAIEALEQLPKIFRQHLRQDADQSLQALRQLSDWKPSDLSAWHEQIDRCFRFRCGCVAGNSPDAPTAFTKIAAVIRSHALLPHLIEDDSASDRRPRCTLYGRFARMGDPACNAHQLERWWAEQTRRLAFLGPEERLSAPALMTRVMGTCSSSPSNSATAVKTDVTRVFLELQGADLVQLLRSAVTVGQSVTERLAALAELHAHQLPNSLKQHKAGPVADPDGRLIFGVQPFQATALAASLRKLAAGFSPSCKIGMVVAASGSGWGAVRQSLDEACQARSNALEMRVLKTHPQVDTTQIPFGSLDTLGQLIRAFNGLDGPPLGNRWAYRFRDLAQTMGDDVSISRSELKRTLDHAESVTPDHQQLIQKLLDEVLDHGGSCAGFAALVTTAVFLARGGAS